MTTTDKPSFIHDSHPFPGFICLALAAAHAVGVRPARRLTRMQSSSTAINLSEIAQMRPDELSAWMRGEHAVTQTKTTFPLRSGVLGLLSYHRTFTPDGEQVFAVIGRAGECLLEYLGQTDLRRATTPGTLKTLGILAEREGASRLALGELLTDLCTVASLNAVLDAATGDFYTWPCDARPPHDPVASLLHFRAFILVTP